MKVKEIDGLFYIVENEEKISNKRLNQVKGYGKIKNEFHPNKGNTYSEFLIKRDAESIIRFLNQLEK